MDSLNWQAGLAFVVSLLVGLAVVRWKLGAFTGRRQGGLEALTGHDIVVILLAMFFANIAIRAALDLIA